MNLEKYTMDEIIHLMYRRSERSATEVAEALCVTANLFYRMVDEADQEIGLAARHLLPYMGILNDDTPLEYLARRRGKMVLEIPEPLTAREQEERLLSEFQSFVEMVEHMLQRYFTEPSEERRQELTVSLEEMARKLLGLRQLIRQ